MVPACLASGLLPSSGWPHDDVIKWKHFPLHWPFVRGIHRWPVNSPHKGQRRGALVFSLICTWTNGWANIRDAGDLRRLRAHYAVIVMNAYGVNLKDMGNHNKTRQSVTYLHKSQDVCVPRILVVTLKTKSCHDANFVVTGVTRCCCYFWPTWVSLK